MKVLTPSEELERPSSLFWHAFLTPLPADIHAHCVPFGGDDWLADVAWHADVQFLAYPQPSAQPLVFETSVPQEYWEFDKGFPLDSTINNVKGH